MNGFASLATAGQQTASLPKLTSTSRKRLPPSVNVQPQAAQVSASPGAYIRPIQGTAPSLPAPMSEYRPGAISPLPYGMPPLTPYQRVQPPASTLRAFRQRPDQEAAFASQAEREAMARVVRGQDHFNAGIQQGTEDASTSMATGSPGAMGNQFRPLWDAQQGIDTAGQQRDALQGSQFGARPAPQNSPFFAGAYEGMAPSAFRTGPVVGTEGLKSGVPLRAEAEANAAARARHEEIMAGSAGKAYGALPFAHAGVGKADAQRQAVLDAGKLSDIDWQNKYPTVDRKQFQRGGVYFLTIPAAAVGGDLAPSPADYNEVIRNRRKIHREQELAAIQRYVGPKVARTLERLAVPQSSSTPAEYHGSSGSYRSRDFSIGAPPVGAPRMGDPRSMTPEEFRAMDYQRAGDAWVQQQLRVMNTPAYRIRRARIAAQRR